MTHTKYFLKDGDFYGNGHAIPHPINPTVVAEIYNNSGKPGRIHLDASDGAFVLTQKGQGGHRLDNQGMLRLLNSIEEGEDRALPKSWLLSPTGRIKYSEDGHSWLEATPGVILKEWYSIERPCRLLHRSGKYYYRYPNMPMTVIDLGALVEVLNNSASPRPAAPPCPISGPYEESPDRGNGLLVYKPGDGLLNLAYVIHELNRLHNALEQARKARNIAELRLKSEILKAAKDRIDAKIEALDKEGLGHD